MGHHYVPQAYLRNFESGSTPPGCIWTFDKLRANRRLLPIAAVAQSPNYYDPEVEKELNTSVEAPANPCLDKLRNGNSLSEQERMAVAVYTATMLKRVPHRRLEAHKLIPGVLDKTIADVQQFVHSVATADDRALGLMDQRLADIEAIRQKYLIEPPPEVTEMIRTPWPSSNMVDAVLNMTWRVLVSSGPVYFITSDNPGHFFSAYGLASKESEFCLPLSTTHALHGCWQPAVSNLVYVQVPVSTVKEINRRVASTTTRMAFYHENVPWLQKLVRKDDPYLSVIHWR
jgi:hypothetical protein